MADIVAVTPDGVEHHFPEGTNPTVIQNTVKKHISSVMAPPDAGATMLDKQKASTASIVSNPNDMRGGADVVDYKTRANVQAMGNGPALGYARSPSEAASNSIKVLRNILPPAASAAAASVSGPLAVPASGGAYSLTDTLLEQLDPNNKKSISESFKDSLVSAALNEAGAKIIGGTWKAAKSFLKADQPEILAFLPTASQALKAEGKMPTVARILKYVEDNFAPGSKAAAQETSAKVGAEKGLKQAGKIAGRAPATVANPNTMAELAAADLVDEKVAKGSTNVVQSYFNNPEELDKLISNPKRLQDALTRSVAAGKGINARQDIGAYNLARIQQAASTTSADGVTHIDPNKISSFLDDPNLASSHKLLYGSKLSDIKQFYKNLAATQDKSQGFGSYSKIRLAFEGISLMGGLAHAVIANSPTSLAVSAAPIAAEIGIAGMAKLLTNPKTSRLMLSLANNEALGVSEQYAAKQIMQALQGTTGALVNKDGSKTPFKVVNGRLVPAE